MKVIIAGSRWLYDRGGRITKAVQMSGFDITEVVSGCAEGIDVAGEKWARRQGIKVTRFPADWRTHGRAAGPIRNEEMADYADALIAFPGSGPGTHDMICRAKHHGLPLYVSRPPRSYRHGGNK